MFIICKQLNSDGGMLFQLVIHVHACKITIQVQQKWYQLFN